MGLIQASLKVAQRSVRATITKIKNFGKPILGRGPFLRSQLGASKSPDFWLWFLVTPVICGTTGGAIYGVVYDTTLYDDTVYDDTVYDDTVYDDTVYDDTVYDDAVVWYTMRWHDVRRRYTMRCTGKITDLSLEGIIQCKQHELLKSLIWRQNNVGFMM